MLNYLPENYKQRGSYYSGQRFNIDTFYDKILTMTMLRSGKINIVTNNLRWTNEILNFLTNCKGEIFLDFIEDTFRTEEFTNITEYIKKRLIEDINDIFTKEDVKFELTQYKEHWVPKGNYSERKSITYPKIICRDDRFVNSEIITPTIELLMDDRFKNAENEFLEGLEHYRPIANNKK